MRKIKDEIQEGMLSAAQAAGAGNTPEVQRMIKELTEPKMNWREYCHKSCITIKTDYTFTCVQ